MPMRSLVGLCIWEQVAIPLPDVRSSHKTTYTLTIQGPCSHCIAELADNRQHLTAWWSGRHDHWHQKKIKFELETLIIWSIGTTEEEREAEEVDEAAQVSSAPIICCVGSWHIYIQRNWWLHLMYSTVFLYCTLKTAHGLWSICRHSYR